MMSIRSVTLIALLLPLVSPAQTDPSLFDEQEAWATLYRSTPEKVHDLVHTTLHMRFDYEKSYAYGKAWITLKPHFFATDSLMLDAKGMDITTVSLVNGNQFTPLSYHYDSLRLSIRLDRQYKRNEGFQVYIEYTAKPNAYKGKGSAAITDAKGMYFINPLGQENKAIQIWTQGETEGTSVWLPTIDNPNQKCTHEFQLTVPDKYVTLSNGKLTTQKKLTTGLRTDTWIMDQPHAPYLFFIGVGDYAVIKDDYKGKEVSYYVEKAYAPVARRIFGATPEMIAYFSRLTGIDYPWVKYAQITGQDYVSGAMENTTSTLHGSSAQQDARELTDGNSWENVIAHELFHQWFGDYVTAESWSNLTLNESFANYSEVLWLEYKYGKDAADEHNYADMTSYLNSGSANKDLVRFYYADKEDMFDAVSYNKGGRILHMLRHYVGDSAFFSSLQAYLTNNAYRSAEAHQLRLAFEDVTGKDLNWFFQQWYFGSGHPQLSIDYAYDRPRKQMRVYIRQTQEQEKVFRLPIDIDLYTGRVKKRYTVWASQRADTFSFPCNIMPDLVNVDADNILLAEKEDNKTLAQYRHQFLYAPTYLDRRAAIEFASTQQENPQAFELMQMGLTDPYKGLRKLTLDKLDVDIPANRTAVEPTIASMAEKEKDPVTRAAAIELLGTYAKEIYKPLFLKATTDSSYTVAGAALKALYDLDKPAALGVIREWKGQPKKGKMLEATASILLREDNQATLEDVIATFGDMPLSQEKFDLLQPLCGMLARSLNTEAIKAGINSIVAFRDAIPVQFGIRPIINDYLQTIIVKKTDALQTAINKSIYQEQIDYIRKAIGK